MAAAAVRGRGRGCSGWDGGDGTWDGGGLGGCREVQHAGRRLALQVLCEHVDLVLGVPLQTFQHHVITAARKADLWLPVSSLPLGKDCGEGQHENRLTGRERRHSL